jgi:hypothetical protein
MQAKKVGKVVPVAILVIVAIFISTGNALADTPSTCSTATNGNVTCIQQVLNQEGTATDSTSVSVKAASHGKSKITMLVAEHFVSSAQMKEARKNGECHWYKEVWNSGFVDGTGKLGWKLDHHVYGCWVNGKLYKYGGGITGDACGNLLRLVKEPPPKTVVYANAKFVGRMKWVATVHVTATAPATVKVMVSVHNADNSCQSSASATGTATGTATATAKAKATSKAAARASAEGKAVKMSGSLKQEASVKASASAKASATAEASAKATCTPTVPPPPTCQETGTCPPPPPPPPCECEPKPEIRITGKTELNMIPAGKTSGPFEISTYASESGGTLTVDPGIGSVSLCGSSTPKNTVTVSVPSGASEACVILYAPEDADKPASMTVTMTACLGAVCDEETETVPITYPTRPS